MNPLEHGLRLMQDVVIPEAYHLVTQGLQTGRPPVITFLLFSVLPAIRLDYQPGFGATKSTMYLSMAT